jgi:hypothetical protein
MRKFLILFSFLTFLGLSQGAQAATPSAQSGPFGLGVILGEPTGVTLKYDTSAYNAIDAGISFRFDRYFMLYGDYHFKFPGAFHTDVSFFNQLTPYVGVGAVAVFENEDNRRYFDDDWDEDFALGVRIPLGIEWRTPRVPLGVFAEIVPGLAIIPGTDAFVQGGIGVRYFF